MAEEHWQRMREKNWPEWQRPVGRQAPRETLKQAKRQENAL
jgi:hypothetical protein